MSTSEALPPVLLVSWEISERGGGQERALFEYAMELEARGVRVEVACRGPGLEGRPHHRLDPAGAGRGAGRLLDAARAVVAEARDRAVVQATLPVAGCHVYVPRGGLVPEALERNARSRGRLARHLGGRGLLFSRNRRDLLRAERELLLGERPPLLVALSGGVERQAARHYGLGAERVRLVRNGIRPGGPVAPEEVHGLRRDLGIPAGAVVFLAAARNPRLKGMATVRRAAARLPREPAWRLVIAGGARARRTDRVVETGAMPRLDALLALADAVVHPTWYDTCSRVVLEAIAAGVPVVTTGHDGASEILGDGGVVLPDPGDVAALAAVLRRWLDPEERARVRARQQGRAAEVSMARHVDAMLPVLREAWSCAS